MRAKVMNFQKSFLSQNISFGLLLGEASSNKKQEI